MNWAHLLEAFLFTAAVLPLPLRLFGLLSDTETLVVMTGALAASAVYTFLQGEAGYVALYVALTVTGLLIMRRRRENARKDTTEPVAAKPRA